MMQAQRVRPIRVIEVNIQRKKELFRNRSFFLVIKNLLLANGYSGAKDPDEHQRIIFQAIHQSLIDVFICLMREEDCRSFSPYEEGIEQLASQG